MAFKFKLDDCVFDIKMQLSKLFHTKKSHLWKTSIKQGNSRNTGNT